MTNRSSGILLHPTSLPGKHGIGDFGNSAYEFINLLNSLKQSLWQVLPLCPVTSGYSPYQSPSAFAGNPLLISLDFLQSEGYLSSEELKCEFDSTANYVDFKKVETWKMARLRDAFNNFRKKAAEEQQEMLRQWCNTQAFWLDDYAIFASMKTISGEQSWTEWPTAWKNRNYVELRDFRNKYEAEINFHEFVQWHFFKQWAALRKYANQQGIQVIGDLPIFVAFESAEVWSNPDLFELDDDLQPKVVAGVPPDYFSESGQRWGNPLYCWDKMRDDGFAWWKKRLNSLFEQFDIVRVDHFRGFENYWEIPAAAHTAIEGNWKQGPGMEFFEEIQRELGELPIIAEDLGLITQEVNALREKCGFPGMKVLQFAFSTENSSYLPHNYSNHKTVVYTGTHDNNTTLGWFSELSEVEKERLRVYVSKNVQEESICYELLRLAWSSTAEIALAPLQDLLNLGGECRMNLPATCGGNNWSWRCSQEQMKTLEQHWISQLTKTYGRNLD